MIVLNGNYVLKEVLESVYPFAHQILVAEGPVRYWQTQGVSTSTDGTNEILDNFPDPQNKLTVVHGQFREKDQQCNAYMRYLSSESDYIWNLDSDEVFKPEDIEKTIKLLEERKATSAGFTSYSFYGGFTHYLDGFERKHEFKRIQKVFPGSYWATHRPPTIAHAPNIQPWPVKHLSCEALADHGVYMYHYSYVFPKQVKEKVAYYKAAVSRENCIDNYYERIYHPWVTQPTQRQQIEDMFDGVHEFKPQSRGECRTKKFEGEHPQVIQNSFLELVKKFKGQLCDNTGSSS
jgi:hypothetical protein